MVAVTSNITVSVDSSQARQGLADLQKQAQSTAQAIRGIGQGGGFQSLASQVNASSSAFTNLARSLSQVGSSASRIAAQSGSSFSGFSRSAHDAHAAVNKLASSLNPLHAALAGLGALAGGLSLQHFTTSILETGNAVTSFKLALDSVATDSGEANRMFDYIAATSNRLGVSLESNLETFKNLRVSMASLGIDTQRTQALFENFGKAFTALHTTQANVKRGYYDISEVFSLNRLDATRVRAISTHIPGFVGALQQALQGADLHEAFRKGIPAEKIEEVAKILGDQYAKAAEAALNHAQANLAIMGNKFTLFREQVFSGGFDSGLTTFLKEMNAALDGAGFKSFGATVGEGFRQAFAGATMLGKAIIDMRSPLAEVLKTLGTFALAVSGVSLLAGAFTLLTSPLGALAALATIVAMQWDNLAATFKKAALGAVESYTLISGLVSGKGWDESKRLAAVAGGEYLQKQAGAMAGEGYAESFLARVKSMFSTMPGMNLDKFNAEWSRLLKESTPTQFEGVSDYNLNATRRDEILLRQAEHAAELSNKLKSLREQLLPTTASFDKLREVLEKIEFMRGKKIGDHAISDSELNRMRDAAKESAFNTAFPAASRIRDLTESVRIDSEALAASGGNRDLMREEKSYLQERLALKRKGVDLTNEESAALKALIHAQGELAKGDQNPLTRWASSQKDGIEGISSSIEHGLDATADALARIAVEGKNFKESMRSLLSSIASDFLRQGIRSLMAEGIKGLNLQNFGGGISDSVKAALGMGESVVSKANASIDDAAKSIASTVTGTMDVQAAVVNVNGALGGLGGASGLDSFKPASDLSKAIRPEAVGGVAPLAKATGPIFGNDNTLRSLPEFGGSIKTALDTIPANSASLFGKDLASSQVKQALGSLPEFGKAIRSSSDSISRNSVAEFGKLINLQKLPTAAQSVTAAGLRAPTAAEELSSLGRTGGSRSWRNSNPGNIEYGPWAKAHGAIGTDGRFAKFPNDAVGTKAQETLLFESAGYKNLTLGQAIHRWAPASENNVPAYIKAMGADPSTRMRDFSAAQRQTLLQNMRQHEGWKPGVDHNSTGSLKQATQGLAEKMNESSQKIAQTFTQKMDSAVKAPAELLKTNLTQDFQSVLGQGAKGAGDIVQLSDSIKSAGDASVNAASNIGNLASKLGSLGGGGGGGIGDAIGGLLGGLFSEGGYTDSPVSSASMPASFWAGAPHFAEGTPNTSGGMPAILHPNEAVIPLSRGREIPVRLEGDGVGGDNRQMIVQNFSTNVTARDHDSFRRNHSQVLESMQKAAGRARARNG